MAWAEEKQAKGVLPYDFCGGCDNCQFYCIIGVPSRKPLADSCEYASMQGIRVEMSRHGVKVSGQLHKKQTRDLAEALIAAKVAQLRLDTVTAAKE